MAAPVTGVLLVNLGTPEEPTPSAVRKYLRQFLWDPRVVRIPRLPWWFILNFLILPLRSGKTAKKYEKVWMNDGSPLRVYSTRQAQMLRGYLGQTMKPAPHVAMAMRYGKPSIRAGLEELAAKECTRVLVIPLYPQYSGTTTGSVEDELAKMGKKVKVQTKLVRDFHDHPLYAKAIAKNVNDYWMKTGRPDRLIISFHGIPKASVAAGDPYEKQCKESARLIATELGWMDKRTSVSYQSRFGGAEWLKPYLVDTLKDLGKAGTNRVDVVCPGFAADCLETLEEVAIEAKATFVKAGGKEFHYIPSTNDTPPWMTALTKITAEHLASWADK